jgi:hypothetical protein
MPLLLLWLLGCPTIDTPCNRSADCGAGDCLLREAECGAYPVCAMRCERDLDCTKNRYCEDDGYCTSLCDQDDP